MTDTPQEIARAFFEGLPATFVEVERIIEILDNALAAGRRKGHDQMAPFTFLERHMPRSWRSRLAELITAERSASAEREAAARAAALEEAGVAIDDLARPSTMRLAAGELSAREVRTGKALLELAARKVRSLQPAQAGAGEVETYKPQVIRYDDAGMYEFVMRDCFSVHRNEGDYDLILDGETREPIGVAWPIPKARPLPPPPKE